jgi:hypothetical protein
MIRLTVSGGVGLPGYHSFPADLPLGDAVMQAGGPIQNAEMDKITIRRGTDLFLDRDEFQIATAEGRSLDRLGLLPGDEVVVPVAAQSWWPQVIRWGVIVASTLTLGIRVF